MNPNPLAAIYDFVVAHPIVTLTMYMCFNAFVGSLKAPSSTSGQFYISLFAVLNALAANFGRMFPKVESSPNFEPAVNLQQKMAGQLQTPVKVPPTVEDLKAGTP
jgi:hypothetical protein